MNSSLPIAIVARSSNTNSFGLREHVIVANNGLAFRALRSAYVPDADTFVKGSHHELRLEIAPELAVDKDTAARAALGALSRCGFECVSRIVEAPRDVVVSIFSTQKAA